MTLEEQVSKGMRAKEILEDEIFTGAFDMIEQEIIHQWQNSPARDAEGREKLYLMLAMSQKFKSTLTRVMETGKLAQVELAHQRTLEERKKEYLSL